MMRWGHYSAVASCRRRAARASRNTLSLPSSFVQLVSALFVCVPHGVPIFFRSISNYDDSAGFARRRTRLPLVALATGARRRPSTWYSACRRRRPAQRPSPSPEDRLRVLEEHTTALLIFSSNRALPELPCNCIIHGWCEKPRFGTTL